MSGRLPIPGQAIRVRGYPAACSAIAQPEVPITRSWYSTAIRVVPSVLAWWTIFSICCFV